MLTALLAFALQALPLPRMVDIPAGTFWMGTDHPPMEDWDEAPRREVKVDAFRMSATPSTRHSIRRISEASKVSPPETTRR